MSFISTKRYISGQAEIAHHADELCKPSICVKGVNLLLNCLDDLEMLALGYLGTWVLGYLDNSEDTWSFGCTCSKRLVHGWFGMITGSVDGIAVKFKGKVVRYA